MGRIEFTKDSLSPNLKRMKPALNRNIYQVLRFHEPNMVAHAKTTAPWQDDTGNARNGLIGSVGIIAPGIFTLTLAGSVPYQIWLEVRFAGKNAVIMPTIRVTFPKVMASFTKLLERMGLNG